MTPASSGTLIGKRIVVAGSSQGIGRAVALRVAQEGGRVVVNGSGQGRGGRAESERVLGELVTEIETAGGEAAAYVGSVAAEAEAAALIDTAVSRWGGLDGLVNCAGIAEPPGSSILTVSPKDWRSVLEVHLDGTLYCCRAAAPHLVEAGGGSIVNTSSHAHLGIYGGTAYAAAKGAVNSLTLAIAAELAAEGVRCNAICPGAKTRLSTGEAYEAKIADLRARGLLSEQLAAGSLSPPGPEGCAALYAILLSEATQEITGRIFSAAGPYIGVFPAREETFLGYKSPDPGEAVDPPPTFQAEELAALLHEKLLHED